MTVVLSDSLLPYGLEELRIPLDVGVTPPTAVESLILFYLLSQPRAEREPFRYA